MKIIELYLLLQQSKCLGYKSVQKRESVLFKVWEKLTYDEQKWFLSFINPLNETYCILTKERKLNVNQENKPFLPKSD